MGCGATTGAAAARGSDILPGSIPRLRLEEGIDVIVSPVRGFDMVTKIRRVDPGEMVPSRYRLTGRMA